VTVDITVVQGMIKETAVSPLVIYYNKHKAVLEETHGADYKIEILNVPEESVLIKTDTFPDTRPFFYGGEGENKRADYMLFSNYKGQSYCLHIELKHGKGGSQEGIANQLRGSHCLWKYICDLSVSFHNGNELLNPAIEHRFVSFRDIKINKKPVYQKKNQKHDKPESMLKLTAITNIQFSRLI